MKLTFSGQGRYPDFKSGYELYLRRNRNGSPLDEKTYAKVVREFCRGLAERLEREGCVDLPGDLGTISAAIITRKPIYRGRKFIGYGMYDWKKGEYDGKLKTFGIVFLPKHNDRDSLRAYGFVANRRLYQRMKEMYDGYDCPWTPIDFNEAMI